MFNLEELKKIDLKNLDINKITAIVTEHKDTVAQIGVIVVSLLILSSMVKGYLENGQENRALLTQLKEKEEVVETYQSSVKKTNTFLEGLPKGLDEDQFSSQLTDYAAANNVSIVAFSPGERIAEPLAEVLTVRLSIKVKEYKNLLSFIKAVETSSHGVRVDNVVALMKSGDVIEVQMDVSSVSVKK